MILLKFLLKVFFFLRVFFFFFFFECSETSDTPITLHRELRGLCIYNNDFLVFFGEAKRQDEELIVAEKELLSKMSEGILFHIPINYYSNFSLQCIRFCKK